MKKLITLIALTPATAFAHGAHVPVSEAAHGTAHAGMYAGLALIAVALVLGVVLRVRS
ncbi:hypothetical protein [Marivita hallyeonensis]|uniref:HupE / UreJ protein n=1 Tax=Marivita hallyeonensis TaxID=996342 RepID=A0A1M5MK94_9RHOB|nr:hypothetical protein [Marivita hallyeonensis]SHG77645.1 hypothetical protein SAMN05443551_0548 [Marivita hallyeonensis]